MKYRVIGFLTSCLFIQSCFGLTLVDDGKPVATIVLPDEPTEYEKLLADDFQFHLEVMSGAALPVVEEKDRPEGVCVDIGATSRGAPYRNQLGEDDNLNDEALLIRVTPNEAIMVGRTDQATKHAVFILLEQLDVRWLMPTNKGTSIPKRTTVQLRRQHTIDQPAFLYRSSVSGKWYPRGAVGKDPLDTFNLDAWAWGHRNRFGGTLNRRPPSHAYDSLVPRRRYFDEHPEYYALQKNGRREPHQLCTSNPEVIRIATETIRGRAKAYPDGMFGIGPNDGDYFCRCDNCLAIEGDNGNLADRMMTFANHIARAIGKDYPSTRFTYFVDYHSKGLPAHTRPEPNLVFWLVRWNTNRAHGIGHPSVDRWEQSLGDWNSYGNPVILYTYYGYYGFFTYWPIVHVMKQEFPHYHKHGVVGMYSQIHGHWGTQGLNFYVYSKLMWNPLADVDAIVDDYCRAAFGPVAKTMRQYYDLLEATMDQTSLYPGSSSQQARIFTPEVVARADALMAEAEQHVKAYTDKHRDPGLSWRMALVARGQRATKLDLGARHALMRYESTRDPALIEQARRSWTEVLRIIDDPAMPGVIENSFFAKGIRKDLAPLLGDTMLYGPGEFRFGDGLDGGGKSAFQTKVKNGFVNGTWGLNLRAKTSGEVIWRFSAKPKCVFDAVKLEHVYFSYAEMDKMKQGPDDKKKYQNNSNELQVRSPAIGEQWVTVVRNKDLHDDEFDITAHTRGSPWFDVRFTARNASNTTICSIDQWSVQGEVVEVGK